MSIQNLFLQFPTLETGRLILRKLELRDLASLYTLYNSPHTQMYQTKYVYTLPELMTYLRTQDRAFQNQTKIMWALERKLDNRFIGIRILYADDDLQFVEMQGDTFQEFWNQGYTKEAYIAILVHLQKCGLGGVYTKVQANNLNAIYLMKSLNFTPIQKYRIQGGIDFIKFAIRLK